MHACCKWPSFLGRSHQPGHATDLLCLAFIHTQGLQLKRHIEATLGSGNIMEAVKLPPGEDLKEWLAVNTVDFYVRAC